MGKVGYWVVRTYEAGNMGEKTKFWVPGVRPDRRNRRKEKSEGRKQAQNAHSAEKELARLLNENFGPGDWLLGLDYGPAGMQRVEERARKMVQEDQPGQSPESTGAEEDGEGGGLRAGRPTGAEETAMMEAVFFSAKHEAELCLRRVKRELDKEGVALRYAIVTSDMDGDTGEAVRVHHHLVINREARDAFARKWAELGHVSWEALSDQDDYTQIAAYMLRQVRHVPDAKKYRTSRNLVRPEGKDRIVATASELRVPKGGELVHRNAYERGQAQYIRYVLPEEKKRRRPGQSPGHAGAEGIEGAGG